MRNILEKYKNENQKLTIILGSGFHVQGIGNNAILSNWGNLLSKLTHNNLLSSEYTLDFEQIIINQTRNQNISNALQADLIERKELKHIADFIKQEQEWVLKQRDRFNYPNVFNPKYVSDVISLNFDHVAEELCNTRYGNCNAIQSINESSFKDKYSEKSKSTIYQRTTYRKITDKYGNEIRFWYPHGSIQNNQSITLGINRYAKLVSDVIRIRNYYKKYERENDDKELIDLTWYSQILKNPVFILGASFSEAEWGLWSALVFKKRNFAKSDKNSLEKNVYKMVDVKSEDKNLGYWYQSLFKDMNFNDQWKMIEESLSE